MEQLVFVLIVGFIALVKWLIERAQNGGIQPPKTGPTPGAPRRRAEPAETEEERMRRFMEALGIPSGSDAPKPVQRRKAHVPPPVVVVAPPLPKPVPVPVERKEPKFEPVESPAALRQSEPASPWAEPKPVPVFVAPVEVETSRSRLSAPVPPPTESIRFDVVDLRSFLRSPESLRAAIVAREILGPPRGLQSMF